jgi:protein-S-isoprenylcysteine O-methyltransferase Ste14
MWAGVIILVFTPWFPATVWKNITEAVSNTSSRFIATLILLLVMFLCYGARKYYQLYYGCIEIVLGLVGCWVGLGKTTAGGYDQYAGSVAIVGGIYLGVRGFINIFESLAAADKQKRQSRHPSYSPTATFPETASASICRRYGNKHISCSSC